MSLFVSLLATIGYIACFAVGVCAVVMCVTKVSRKDNLFAVLFGVLAVVAFIPMIIVGF